MLSFVDYQALLDFSGLALIRETCASHAIGFNVENLPPLDPAVLRKLHAVPAVSRSNDFHFCPLLFIPML